MVDSSSYNSAATTVASGIITGLAILFVAVRFYVRAYKTGIGADDWWCLVGLLSYLLTGGLLLYSVNVDPAAEKAITAAIFSNSTSSFDSTPHTTYLKLSFVCTILYFSVVTAIKVSILLMYRRLFSVDATFRLHSLILGIVVLAFWVAASLATVFNCNPVKYNWIGLVLEEHCFNFNIFWMVTGSVEVVIDTLILALPVRMVLRLELSRRQKASIVFVFLLGSFVIITGIIRVIYGYIPSSRAPEYTKAGLWSTVHIIMGIICACLPTLRPLFPRTFLIGDTSTAIRRRYYEFRGQEPKDLTSSDSGVGSRNRYTLEALPLKDARAEIEVAPATRDESTSRCVITKQTQVVIESEPREPEECHCSATIQDPRMTTMWLEGDPPW